MPRTIGPDYHQARDQHLGDLPIAKVLSGMTRVAPKGKNKTMIEMSLSVNSIDMDLSQGVFKTDGYIALTWNDPRYYIWQTRLKFSVYKRESFWTEAKKDKNVERVEARQSLHSH